MNAQRSMTDEQILAKYGYDKEPWIDVDGSGRRWAGEMGSGFGSYKPRADRIPSRDPLPFLTGLGGRCAGQTFRFFNATSPGYFAPRKEFRRPPVNPVLAQFRDEQRSYSVADTEVGQISDFLFWLQQPKAWGFAVTPDQIEFARAVLTRLANLTAVTQ